MSRWSLLFCFLFLTLDARSLVFYFVMIHLQHLSPLYILFLFFEVLSSDFSDVDTLTHILIYSCMDNDDVAGVPPAAPPPTRRAGTAAADDMRRTNSHETSWPFCIMSPRDMKRWARAFVMGRPNRSKRHCRPSTSSLPLLSGKRRLMSPWAWRPRSWRMSETLRKTYTGNEERKS